MWFKLLGLHLQHFSFIDLLDFLAIIMDANDKPNSLLGTQEKFQVFATNATILKKFWEAKCDAMFNIIPIDLVRVIILAKMI